MFGVMLWSYDIIHIYSSAMTVDS